MRMLNRVCAVAYEVAFVLFFCLALMAPFHAGATRHLTMVRTLDASHAIISGDLRGLRPRDSLPLYRFNYNWKLPIGEATIDSIDSNTATISVDNSYMSWPIARQAVVKKDANGNPYVEMGSNVDLQEGSMLNLFRNHMRVGQALIGSVGKDTATLEIGPDIDTNGLIASEYAFPDQVAVFQNPFITALEIALIAAALIIYVAVYAKERRSPFIILGEKIRALPIERNILFWVVNLLAGIPFTWFMAKMPLHLFAYVIPWLDQYFFHQTLNLIPLVNSLLPYAYALVGFAYYGFLFWKRRSSILAFWNLISWKEPVPSTALSRSKKVTWQRGIVMWALHLIIVYVFALTLFGFLNGDLLAAEAIHDPFGSREAFFEYWKYIVWALTVVGCLLGYGYSILSILWGKFIRNLDFTVTGWLTNGFCYPLFGVVIWQMIPSFTGADPIITAGPAEMLMLILGLFLNVIYMLSIWNLGTLFDLMTDKGVRTWGFYSTVRHPNYTLEVSMFFVTELVGLSAGIEWLAILMYFFIYWIRSEREDNFMGYSNPEYIAYREASPWKFIPGIY
jgi:protein-S-isoprenylcysteine O-methyltransferase Ste14